MDNIIKVQHTLTLSSEYLDLNLTQVKSYFVEILKGYYPQIWENRRENEVSMEKVFEKGNKQIFSFYISDGINLWDLIISKTKFTFEFNPYLSKDGMNGVKNVIEDVFTSKYNSIKYINLKH